MASSDRPSLRRSLARGDIPRPGQLRVATGLTSIAPLKAVERIPLELLWRSALRRMTHTAFGVLLGYVVLVTTEAD